MPDLANLVLAIDSSQVPKATAALDGLTAAGVRAEAAAGGLRAGVKGAGVEAATMAAAAQASARAAQGMATGFRASADAARVNTLAMRETLVVARELSRGNFTRLPGSLTLLGQGIGSQGGVGAYAASLARTLGLVKTVQNAELAEAAASAAASAAAIEGAAKRAASNVTAADTEMALAEAQLRVTAGTSAEVAAQVRLAEAHQAVAAAAAESAVAENALASAYAREAEAAAASSAATKTVIGGTGVGLIGLGAVTLIAYAAIKKFQDQVKESGELDRFAEGLRLSSAQIEKAGGKVKYLSHNVKEVSGLTVSFKDIMAGVWDEVAKESGQSSGDMKKNVGSAFDDILGFWDKTSAAISAGLWTLGDIAKDVFHYIGQKIGQSFFDGVNRAIDALNGLNAKIPKWAGGGDPNLIPHISAGPPIKDLGSLGSLIRSQADQNYKDALAANHAAFAGIEGFALQHAKNRLQAQSDAHNPPKGAHHHTPADQFDDISARLNEQILSAKKDLASGISEQAQYELQSVDVAKSKTISDAQRSLKEHKLTASEEQQVELLAVQLAQLQKQKIMRDYSIAQMKAQEEILDQQYQFQVDNLKFADSMATTQAAHRKIQLEMLDIETQQKEAQLKSLLAQEAAANDWTNYALNAAKLFNLPTETANQRAGIIKSTEDPLHKWMDEVPHTADAINEALQSIEVKGFDGLASAIAGVVTGTESLKQAFSDLARSIISDIVQMTIKMLIFKALTSAFGKYYGTPQGSANGNVFSMGALMPFAVGGVVAGPTLFPMAGGRTGLMGEAGPEAVMPLARDNQGRLGVRAANNNQSGPIEVHVLVDTSENLDAKMVAVSAQTFKAGAPILVKAAVAGTMRAASRPKLMGRS